GTGGRRTEHRVDRGRVLADPVARQGCLADAAVGQRSVVVRDATRVVRLGVSHQQQSPRHVSQTSPVTTCRSRSEDLSEAGPTLPLTLEGRDGGGTIRMRFLHTADWQLGMTRHFLNDEAQPRYSAARRDVVAALGPLAAEVGAEFVVVAGDVFEDNHLAPRVVSQSLEAMRGIGVPVYLLPGNHDPLDASSVYTSALFTAECPDNVTVLDRPGVHEVRPGLQIVAAPWMSKAPTTDLVAAVIDDLPAD